MLKKLLIVLLGSAIIGCSSSYQSTDVSVPTSKLDRDLGVLIATPVDGKFEDIVYEGSGSMTANALRDAFVEHTERADITNSCQGVSCLQGIDANQYGYFVKAEIFHWEDRATEWTGKPDRIEVHLTVYAAATKEELAKTSFVSNSKWSTLGGDHPQDLLAEPINEFVSQLYAN
ncbi:DUF4823 domain-containing protein [Umboniibacter marinipuniceus]|uniref:Uncharacterized protein DUF4823 n=1 Tax=Umboniibacter marinipuniceus TaxID=569599 RepID=A0A3M0AUK4_9GAMM|nr:DUF4823 domain-containing protein [Umboniibacter marinipuniceus]RMA82642.1 uncharacterized protein DUF4823 [Umboniibacter marinipuniceus]